MCRCQFFRYGILVILIAVFCHTTHADDDSTATYGGYTLTEWKLLIKNNSLEELGSPRAVLGLVEIVTDQSAPAMSRRQAALTLGRVGEPAAIAVPAFRSILKREIDSQESQLWALKALAYLGESAEVVTPEIAQIILDKNRTYLERMQAVETLGKVGGKRKESVATLIQMLRETERAPEQKELRMVVANGLWHLKEAAAPALPELIRAAQDPWALTRLAAIQSIGNIGPLAEIAVPTLVDAILFDDSGEVREVAADALRGIGAAAMPAFQQLQQDQSIEVRKLAIRGLTGLNSAASVAALESSLLDNAEIVKVLAGRALLGIASDHQQSILVLINGLASNDREVVITAYRTLQRDPKQLIPYRDRLEQLKTTTHGHSHQSYSKLIRDVDYLNHE